MWRGDAGHLVVVLPARSADLGSHRPSRARLLHDRPFRSVAFARRGDEYAAAVAGRQPTTYRLSCDADACRTVRWRPTANFPACPRRPRRMPGRRGQTSGAEHLAVRLIALSCNPIRHDTPVPLARSVTASRATHRCARRPLLSCWTSPHSTPPAFSLDKALRLPSGRMPPSARSRTAGCARRAAGLACAPPSRADGRDPMHDRGCRLSFLRYDLRPTLVGPPQPCAPPAISSACGRRHGDRRLAAAVVIGRRALGLSDTRNGEDRTGHQMMAAVMPAGQWAWQRQSADG